MKYEVSITSIGNLASTFLRNNKSIIILNHNVYPNFSDMVVEHTEGNLSEDIAIGDKLILGREEYTVVSIGENAIRSLREEGHCTLVFSDTIELPGQIAVKGDVEPRLMVGDTIRFE